MFSDYGYEKEILAGVYEYSRNWGPDFILDEDWEPENDDYMPTLNRFDISDLFDKRYGPF